MYSVGLGLYATVLLDVWALMRLHFNSYQVPMLCTGSLSCVFQQKGEAEDFMVASQKMVLQHV